VQDRSHAPGRKHPTRRPVAKDHSRFGDGQSRLAVTRRTRAAPRRPKPRALDCSRFGCKTPGRPAPSCRWKDGRLPKKRALRRGGCWRKPAAARP